VAASVQAAMPKSIHRLEYRILLDLLRAKRLQAEMTQAACSAALGRHQSFMSDVERGVRRLDVVQLRDICNVLGTDLVGFIRDYERTLRRQKGKSKGR
jgi:transcriptional regulator with XRE-family HTH domain